MANLLSNLEVLWQDLQSRPAAAVVSLVLATLALLQLLPRRAPGPRFLIPFLGETLSILRDPAAFFLKG